MLCTGFLEHNGAKDIGIVISTSTTEEAENAECVAGLNNFFFLKGWNGLNFFLYLQGLSVILVSVCDAKMKANREGDR